MKKFNKKSLGQNFLIDKNIIKKIINLVKIEKKNIIEIGPGTGALTEEILNRKPKSVITIEKDDFLSKKLHNRYYKTKIFRNINADVLKVDLEKLSTKASIIFGNLPYNISSQILIKLIKYRKWPPNFTDAIFMFQKELGEKILGRFPSNNYGRISILTNYRLNVITKFYVSASCFFPKPNVESVIIHFRPKEKINFRIKNLKNLEKVTNILFSNKRKMINKNIKKILSENKIKMIKNLNLQLRPSKVKPEIYYRIAQLYEST